MAKKPTDTGKTRASSNGSVSWVNYNLTTDEKKTLKSADFDADNALLRLVEESYKVTLGYDKFNECFSCFIIPAGENHRHSGMILSGRGSTPLKAVKQACYIHWNVFAADWSDERLSQREELDD